MIDPSRYNYPLEIFIFLLFNLIVIVLYYFKVSLASFEHIMYLHAHIIYYSFVLYVYVHVFSCFQKVSQTFKA